MRTMLSLAAAFLFASSAFGEEVKVYAAAAVKEPLLKMVAQYEAKTGHTVVCVFDTAGATNQKYQDDPQAALLITTQALISQGEKNGRLKAGMTYVLGDTVASIAAPPRAP